MSNRFQLGGASAQQSSVSGGGAAGASQDARQDRQAAFGDGPPPGGGGGGGGGGGQGGGQRAAPVWPGLDGLADFEENMAIDQEAFVRQFGEPRSSGIDFSKYDSIDCEIVDTAVGKPALPKQCKTFIGFNLGKVLTRNLT